MNLHTQDIAQYLTDHPDFFDQHPELLSGMQLPHPHNGQAISLIERQSLMLRERVKALELRIAELVRHGQENDAIANKLVHWCRTLLSEADAPRLPATLVTELKRVFDVPFAGLRLWKVAASASDQECARPVAKDTITLADSMRVPFCGANVGFEAAAWLDDGGAAVQSIAMLPLRVGADPHTFGLLVLGSSDKNRFHADMGTAFLERIAELASAALARLRA